MVPLDLPITVVAISNNQHDDMADALRRTLAQIAPRQILIFTDEPAKILIPGAEYREFHGDYVGAMCCLWYEVPHHVKMSHFLWVQPDSWVLDASKWRDEFLDFDYVGAPWPLEPGNDWDRLGIKPGKNVGNGGFSLRSLELAQYICDRPDNFLLWLPEDDAICRKHRLLLEMKGFCWANPELAAKFSFECAPPPPDGTFGFHGHWHASAMRGMSNAA